MMGMWGNMMGGWGGYGYGGYGGMGFMMIIPLVIGIGLILYLFRHKSFQAYPNDYNNQGAALDILRERYARGEIGTTEFQSKKQDLGVVNLKK